MVKLYSALLSVILMSSSWALSAVEVLPYRDAQLVKSELNESVNVDIPLGKINRSGRGWEPESIFTVKADEFSSLYKINRNALLPDVYSHYHQQLAQGGQKIAFECQGRSCGSSNAWANNFFQDYLLYGADQSQYLLVVESSQGGYQTLYLNRRGAGDVMVRFDVVTPESAPKNGSEVVAQMDVNDIPRIRRFLNDLPEHQVVVAFVTSASSGAESSVQRGDAFISNIVLGLGGQLKTKVRFINLANMGRESLGMNRVTFVYDDK